MAWTQEEIERLRALARSEPFFKTVAEKIGRPVASVRWKAKKLKLSLLRPGKMGGWNAKHAHLREEAMRYFLDHSMEETREEFGLSVGELKSLFTVGYRDPSLAHLRKETRRHDAWTLKETVFLIRHAGIQPRDWIAMKLKRGTMHSVKEQLYRLNSNSKYLNGIPVGWARELFGNKTPHGIKTNAGPSGGIRANFRFRIITWLECEELAKGARLHPTLRSTIRSMAKFQRWIHGIEKPIGLRRRIKNELSKK